MILSERPRLREAMLVLATVSAAWLVLAWPWLAGGLTIPWDAKIHFQAMLRWLADRLAEGDLPLWMPETFAGRPALGDPQSMLLSPGFLILAALDPDPSARAGDMVVLTELLIGGVATALFGLRRGWHPVAAILAALVMMVGASASGRLQHTLLVQSHAFIPVVLLALDAALDRPTLLRAALAGAAVGALVVGRDQVAYLGLIALSAFVAARLLAPPDRLAFLRARLPAGMVAVLVAATVAAVPVLATIEFAEVSNRPAFDFAVGAAQSLPPAGLLTAVIPNLFGSVTSDAAYWGPGSDPWRPWVPADRTTVQLYAGAVPIVLVLWVGVLRGRLLGGAGWLLAGLGLFFVVYAVGHHTPVFRILFDHLPGVDKFRRPSDATFAIGAVVALAAGWLCDRVVREGVVPVAPWRRALEMAVVAALAIGSAWLAYRLDRLAETLPALGISLALTAAAVALLLRVGPAAGRWRAPALAALVLLTVLDLRVFTVGTPLNARPIEHFQVLDDPDEVPLAAWLEARVNEIEDWEGPVRVEVLGLGGAWQNASMVIGVEGTLGYNPLRLADYETAVGAGQNSDRLPARRFGTLMTGYRSDFADLLGVRLIALGAPMETIDPAGAAALGPPRRVGSAWVYENRRALPRVLFIGREGAHPHDPDALIAGGGLPALDWRREALIDPLPEPAAASPGPSSAGEVRITARSSDRIDLDVTARRAGFVVLHDIAYPGWVAYVDGERQELRRANVLFMAVPVAVGRHTVAFAYEPLAPGHLWALLSGAD